MEIPRLSRKYRRVVQLELNEISRPILDRLAAEGAIPGFSALDRDCAALETTSEQRYEELEPWIQWTTAHTGKTFAEHRVFRLGDARHAGHPQTWELLSAHGIESAVLGSMNAHRGTARGGMFFPDPWAKENDTHPEGLRALWTLISRQVQGHAVAQPKLMDVIRGAAACLQMRVPPSLQAQIAAQVVRQRIDRRSAWRMAGIFDQFLYEIFRHVLRTTSFGYYTLFLNSVAHYQHHFWRQFDRSGFDAGLTCPDCHPGDDPLRYGYMLYDRIVSQLRELTRDPSTLLVVLSGLSQEPYRDKESEGGCNYWRLRDHRAFAQRIGLDAAKVYPMMSRDWQVEASDGEGLARAKEILTGLRVGDERLFHIDQNQPLGVFVETELTRAVTAGEMIVDRGGAPVCTFDDAFVRIAIKSGKHVGTGVLWLSDREASTPRRVPLAAVHHTVLRALGVQPQREDQLGSAA